MSRFFIVASGGRLGRMGLNMNRLSCCVQVGRSVLDRVHKNVAPCPVQGKGGRLCIAEKVAGIVGMVNERD